MFKITIYGASQGTVRNKPRRLLEPMYSDQDIARTVSAVASVLRKSPTICAEVSRIVVDTLATPVSVLHRG